jgi:hypothetical protein
MITAGAAAIVFAVVLLAWAVALIPRRTIPDYHMWLYTVAFAAFLSLLYLATTDQQLF